LADKVKAVLFLRTSWVAKCGGQVMLNGLTSLAKAAGRGWSVRAMAERAPMVAAVTTHGDTVFPTPRRLG
jgi:hypothetical protein